MKTILAVSFVLFCATAYAEDMQKYLFDTNVLARRGEHAEALERHQWFHEHALEHDPAMVGVRLSFALSAWKKLSDDYPPARVALLETRDHTIKQVLETGGTFALFQDAAAFNRVVGRESQTVDLFEQVDKAHPDLAKRYWFAAKDAVFAAQRFDLAGKYFGDPVQAFSRVKEMYELNTSHYNDPKFGGAAFKQFNERNFVNEIDQLLSVAMATGKSEAAVEIQKKALAVLDDPRLRKALPLPTTEEPAADSAASPDAK